MAWYWIKWKLHWIEFANTDRYGNVWNVCQVKQDVTVDKMNIKGIHEIHAQLTCFLCICLCLSLCDTILQAYNKLLSNSLLSHIHIFNDIKHGAGCTATIHFYE